MRASDKCIYLRHKLNSRVGHKPLSSDHGIKKAACGSEKEKGEQSARDRRTVTTGRDKELL